MSRRRLTLESLEDRTLLAVSASLPMPNEVHLAGVELNNVDDVTLRVTNGLLEFRVSDGAFRRDMDAQASGEQQVTVDNSTVIKVDVGGTVFIGQMSQGGGQILSLGKLEVMPDVTVSTRVTASGADQLTAASTGDSLNLTLQAPEIVVGNGARILSHVESGSTFRDGDLQFIADTGFDFTWDAITPFFRDLDATAKIDVGSATIRGRNIDIASTASSTKFADFDLDAAELANQYNAHFAKLVDPQTIKLTFELNSGADTITRANALGTGAPGSWIQEGFEAGQLIVVAGTVSNDGKYRIDAVTDQVLTLASFHDLSNEVVTGAEVQESQARMAGNPGLTFTRNTDAGDTIVRQTGSWIADGFNPGQTIYIDNTDGNDGEFVVTSVTETTLTLNGKARLLKSDVYGVADTFAMTGAPALIFTRGELDASIRRTTGSWLGDGFKTGRNIEVTHSDSTLNVGRYQVVGVTDDTLTIGLTDDVVDVETAAAGYAIQSLFPTIDAVLTDLNADSIPISAHDRLGNLIPNTTLLARDVVDRLKLESTKLQNLDGIIGIVQGVLSDSTSTITIHSGANLVATEDVHVRSRAVSDVSISSPGLQLPTSGFHGDLGAPLAVGFGSSESDAQAILQGGANVTAGGNFIFTADSVNNLKLQMWAYSGLIVGSDSLISGASRIATRFSGSALTKLSGPVKVPFPALTAAYGRARSDSLAHIEPAANVNAGTANIAANNTNNFDVTSTAQVMFPGKNAGNGLAVSATDIESDAKALLDGNLSTTGSAVVDAVSINTANNTSGISIIKDEIPTAKIIGIIGSKNNTINGVSEMGKAYAGNDAQFGLAAGVAFALSSNQAESRVGGNEPNPGPRQVVDVGSSLDVTAEAEDNFNSTALGTNDSFAQASIGGAVNFSKYANKSLAYIGQDVTIDVSGRLNVTAEAEIPNQVTYDDVFLDAFTAIRNFQFDVDPLQLLDVETPVEFGDALKELVSHSGSQFAAVAGNLAPIVLLGLKLGDFPGKLATSFTAATAKAKVNLDPAAPKGKFAFAGTANVMLLDNSAEAFIAKGARVNQNRLTTSEQVVNVDATADIESVNMAGLGDIIAFALNQGAGGVTSDGSAVGTNLTATIYSNNSLAHIDDGARVRAHGDVIVDAETDLLNLGMAQAGGNSNQFGLAFSGAATYFTNNTVAWIEESAVVESNHDVQVLASTDMTTGAFGLSHERGGQVSIGALVGVNIFDNVTTAFVGNVAGEPESGGLVKAANDVIINAETKELLISMGLAAASASGAPPAPAPPGSSPELVDGALENQSSLTGSSQQAGQTAADAKTGSGVGRLAGGLKSDAATAWKGLKSGGGKLVGAPGQIVSALSSLGGPNDPNAIPKVTRLKNFLGGKASSARETLNKATSGISDKLSKSPVSTSETNVSSGIGISGDAAVNVIDDATEAFISDGATVIAGSDLKVLADNSALLVNNTLAVTATTTAKGAAIAGSMAGNYLERATRAYTENATLRASGVYVDANTQERDITITAGGGGAAHGGPTNVGIVGSINLHILVNDTTARLGEGTRVEANPGISVGEVVVSAANDVAILGAAGGVAVAGGSAIGGAVDVVYLGNSAEATIADGVIVETPGSVTVLADNQEKVLGLSAMVAAGIHNLGLEGSANAIVLVTSAQAGIGDATVTAGDGVRVDANNDSQLISVAGGFAGGETAAIGASLAGMFVLRDVTAEIGDGAEVTARGISGVTVEATADELLISFAASGTLSANVAVSGSIDAIGNFSNVVAHIGDADITSAGDVAVLADANTDIISAAGSLGISTGTAGAGLATDLHGIERAIRAEIADGANVEADKNVVVRAMGHDRAIAASASLAVASAGAGTGSVTALAVINTINATIEAGASVAADGSVAVEAAGQAQFLPFAGVAAFSSGVGVGVANNTIVHIDTVTAEIEPETVVVGLGQSEVDIFTGERSGPAGDLQTEPARGVIVSAVSFDDSLAIAVGGVITGDVSVLGSIVDAALFEDTTAHAGGSINVNNTGAHPEQVVRVKSSDVTTIGHTAGSLAASGTVSVGISADIVLLKKTTEAAILDDTEVHALSNVLIDASSRDNVISGVIAGSIAGEVGVAGAASIYTLVTTTRSAIQNQARVTTGGAVAVFANGTADIKLNAGQVAVGGGPAGVGASNTTLVHVDTVDAFIDDGAVVTADFVWVNANSSEELITIALGAAGASNVAVAGSATLNSLVETTRAIVGSGAQVQAGTLWVYARDTSQLNGAAGAVAVAVSAEGGASVGAGADVGVFKKETVAEIGDDAVVNAGNVIVSATSSEQVNSVAVAGSIPAGIAIGIAGSAGIQTLVLDTRSRIGKRARVRADGSVSVNAEDETELLQAEGNVTIGAAGGGASVAGVVVVKNTDALIDDEAIVDALGNAVPNSTVTARTGKLFIGHTPYLSGDIIPPALRTFNIPGVDTTPATFLDADLLGKRTVTPEVELISGVSVSAFSRNETKKIVVGGGISNFTVSFAGAANVFNDDTRAAIGEHTLINTDREAASPVQSVNVNAGSDFHALTVAGTAASVGASGDLNVLNASTEASIGASSEVYASGHIRVIADATEDILTLALAGAQSGAPFGGAAGSIGATVINTETRAFIGDDAIVKADGNILVHAQDTTDVDMLAGSVAFGGGLGASLAASVIEKDTQAFVGARAVVDALANTNVTLPTYGGAVSENSFSRWQIKGLVVEAISNENIFSAVVSGNASAGAPLGLAGAVSVEIIDVDTKAFIGELARINTDRANAAREQSITVSAVNDTRTFVLAGSLSVALAGGGFAGGLDLAIVRNDTTAYIGNGAEVHASSTVDVYGLSNKDFVSFAVSAAAGQVGLGGAVTTLILGGNLSSDASESITSNDGSDQTAAGYVDEGLMSSGFVSLLGQYSDDDANDGSDEALDNTSLLGGSILRAREQMRQALPDSRIASEVDATQVSAGVSAFIGDQAVVSVGDNVHIAAVERVEVDQVAGGLGIGLSLTFGGIGFGGSAAVAETASHTNAHVGQGSQVRFTGTAAGQQNLSIVSSLNENIDGRGFAGGAGGLIGLGAQVVLQRDASTQAARVDANAEILDAQSVSIAASADRTFEGLSIGGALAGGVAAGVAVADIEAGGGTLATIGDNTRVGQSGATNSVLVSARNTTNANARTIAVAAGIGIAGQGNQAAAEVTPEVMVTVGAGAAVGSSSLIRVDAIALDKATARADGISVAGGLAIGVSLAEAELAPKVNASIGDNAVLEKRGGSGSATIEVLALHNFNSLDLTPDNSRLATAAAHASGGGLLLAGNGADADATASPEVRTTTGKNVRISANTINLRARANNKADADADGITVGGGLGVGVIFSDATAAGLAEVSLGERNVITTPEIFGSFDASAQAYDLATSDTTAATGGILAAGTAAKAEATSQPHVHSTVGKESQVSGSLINVTAQSFTEADAMSHGITIAAGLTVGVSLADATIAADVRAEVGNNAVLNAGGAIKLHAAHDTDFTSDPLFPGFSRGADARAENLAGSAIGIGGAFTDCRNTVDVKTSVGKQAQLVTAEGGVVDIKARNSSWARAVGDGNVIAALVGVGGVFAESEVGGETSVSLGESVRVDAGDIILDAASYTDSDARTDSATGGLIVAVNGSDASSTNNHVVRTTTGKNALLTADNDISILAFSRGFANSDASGLLAGLVTVGGSFASSNRAADVLAEIAPGGTVDAAGNVDVRATFSNHSGDGAAARGSAGTLIGVTGSDSAVNSLTNLSAAVGENARVTAGGNLSVTGSATSKLNASANNKLAGGFTFGSAAADSRLDETIAANVGKGAILHGQNVFVESFQNSDNIAWSHGIGDGLITFFGSAANSITLFSNTANVGEMAKITAVDTVRVKATSDAEGDLRAKVGEEGADISGVSSAQAGATGVIGGRDLDYGDYESFGSLPSISRTNVSFQTNGSAPDTINSDGANWLSQGVRPGDTLTFSGRFLFSGCCPANNFKVVRVASVNGDTLTLTPDSAIFDEAPNGLTTIYDIYVTRPEGNVQPGEYAATRTSIGRGSQIHARNVDLDARVLNAAVGHDKDTPDKTSRFLPETPAGDDDAIAVVDVSAALGLTSAVSNVWVVTTSDVAVAEGVVLHASDQVRLGSRLSGVKSYSTTDSDPDGIVDIGPLSVGAGVAGAHSANLQFAVVQLNVAPGVEITANHLQVDANLDPVTWDTRAEGFQDQGNNQEEEQIRKSRGDVLVDFNGTVNLLRGAPSLTVNADGSVTASGIDFIRTATVTVPVELRGAIGLGNIITRLDSGNWVNDGFLAGDEIIVRGSTSNDGTYRVTTVGSNLLFLDRALPQLERATVSIARSLPQRDALINFVNDPNGDAIVRLTPGSYVDDGFRVDQRVRISGLGIGERLLRIKSVNGNTLQFFETDVFNANGGPANALVFVPGTPTAIEVTGINSSNPLGDAQFNMTGIVIPNPDQCDFESRLRSHDIDLVIADNADDLEFYSEAVTLTGSPRFNFITGSAAVNIVNHSDLILDLGDLSIPSGAGLIVPTDEFNFTRRPRRDSDGNRVPISGVPFSCNLSNSQTQQVVLLGYQANSQKQTVAGGPASIHVENTSAADVVLSGGISNADGSTAIINRGGDIVSSTSTQLLISDQVQLTSEQGTIGSTWPVNVLLNRVADGRGLRASAADDLWLGLQGTFRNAPTNTANIFAISAGGDITVDLRDRIDAGVTPITVATTFFLHRMDAGGDITIGGGTANNLSLFGTLTAGGNVSLATSGKITDSHEPGTVGDEVDIRAASTTISAGGAIGGSIDPLELDVDRLEASAGSGDIWLTNDGDLTIGGVNGVNGLAAPLGNVNLRTSGGLALSEPIATSKDVKLTVGGILTQTSAETSIAANDLIISAGGIGTTDQPLVFNADTLQTNTSTAGGDQFLQEVDTVTLPTSLRREFGVDLLPDSTLDAGAGTITLAGGTFVLNGTVGSNLVVTGGTLKGKGTVDGTLTVLNGTAAPGTSPGVRRSGPVTLTSNSELAIEIDGNRLTPIPEYDQLLVNGPIDLGGAQLSVVASILPDHLDRFTIVQASGPVTGRFAQDQINLENTGFSVVYSANRVDLVANRLPAVAAITRQTPEDSPLMLTADDFTAAFQDPDGPLAELRFDSVTNGRLIRNGVDVTLGQMIPVNALSQLQFIPSPEFSGLASVEWSGFDGVVYAPGTISINVAEVNDAPQLSSAEVAIAELESWSFTLTATDIDSPAADFTFSLGNNAPLGVVIDAASGRLTWTPTEAQGPARYSFTVRVSDNGTPPMAGTATIVIDVTEVNVAPTLTAVGNKSISENQLLAFNVVATDVDVPTNALSYQLDPGAPTGAAIHPTTGVFTWTPAEAQEPGTFNITVRVTDNGTPSLSDTETIQITVAEVNQAPVLAAIGNKSANEGQSLTFSATATDPDVPANTLAYSLDAGAPAGASIHATTGVFTWTPTEAQGPGTFSITIRVTDNGTPSLSDTETLQITVAEVNQAPVLAAIGNKSVNEGEPLTFTATATDADTPANTLTFSLDAGAPAGVSIDPVTGVFTWTPTEAQGPGTFDVTIRVADNGTPSLSHAETIAITVAEVNQAPVLAAIGNVSVDEGSLLTFTASASDTDLPANVLTFSLDAGAPAGASIDPATGVFTWTPTEAQSPGTFDVTIRVTDDGTPSRSHAEKIAITVAEVNQAPVLTAIGNKLVDERSLLTFTASATDTDLPVNTLTFSLDAGAPIGASIDPSSGVFTWTPTVAQGPGMFNVTVRVSDSGVPVLHSSSSFTIQVIDLTPWTNSVDPLDVNADGFVSPMDALVIINDLDANGPRQLASVPSEFQAFLDANGDGFVSPVDALIVINRLNAPPTSLEGEYSRPQASASDSVLGVMVTPLAPATSAISTDSRTAVIDELLLDSDWSVEVSDLEMSLDLIGEDVAAVLLRRTRLSRSA